MAMIKPSSLQPLSIIVVLGLVDQIFPLISLPGCYFIVILLIEPQLHLSIFTQDKSFSLPSAKLIPALDFNLTDIIPLFHYHSMGFNPMFLRNLLQREIILSLWFVNQEQNTITFTSELLGWHWSCVDYIVLFP